MTTTIHSNGSKWAGEQPDSIETLCEVLGSYVLDRRFENPKWPTFVSEPEPDGTVRFFGNFLNLSHVFSIDTDEPDVIARLTALITANMQRPDYLGQCSHEERARAEEEYRRARDARRDEERKRHARIVLGLEG